MAIKFRRIEDRKESVAQLRRRTSDRKARRRILPKLMIVVVIALVIGAYFAYFRPPQIVAPFLVHVEAVQVSSPVAGTLVWLVDKDAKEIEQGDVIARIEAQPQTSGSPGARLTELRLRSAAAGAELQTEQASRDALQVRLQEQERQLGVQVGLLEERLGRSETDVREAARKLSARQEDLETAEELKPLGAATESDYLTATRAVEEAEAAHQTAQSHLRSLKGELAAARESLEGFQTTKRASLAAAESRIRGAQSSNEALRQAREPLVAAFSEEGAQYNVQAPVTGILFELDVTEKSYIQEGEALLSLYTTDSKVARAYVPVRYREGLRLGASARLYAKGYKESGAGEVVYIHDRVVPLPRSLSRRLGYDEANVVPVDISLTGAPSALFVPGQAGKAVIKK